MNLGIKPKETDCCPTPCCPENKDEMRYPSLDLRDEQVDRVKGEHQCDVLDEYTATVRLRVTRISDDMHGKSLGFDVLELDEFTPADGGEEEENAAEAGPKYKPRSGKKVPKGVAYAIDGMK